MIGELIARDFNWKITLICTLSITAIRILVTLVPSPKNKGTLIDFYAKVQLGGPGWKIVGVFWKKIKTT